MRTKGKPKDKSSSRAEKETKEKPPVEDDCAPDAGFKVGCPVHVRYRRWKLKEAITELEELRKWLSDGDPFKISFDRFASERGYCRQRISEWAEKWPTYRKLQELYGICKSLQTDKYMIGGLTQKYSTQMSQFGLINCCGMKSKSVLTHEGIPDLGKRVENAPASVKEYFDKVTGKEDAGDK